MNINDLKKRIDERTERLGMLMSQTKDEIYALRNDLITGIDLLTENDSNLEQKILEIESRLEKLEK